MATEVKKVKRLRLNVGRTLLFFLFIYLIVSFCIYLYKEPVKHYEITGNDYLKDSDILRKANLVDYPPFVSVIPGEIEKNLESYPFIKEAKVSYNWNFQIDIKIVENTPMFIAKSINKVVLSDGSLVSNDNSFIGMPTLLNDTTEEARKELATNLKKVDKGILFMISEIEYTPTYSSTGVIIDDKRFLLSMDNKVLIYITANKASRLNDYLDILENINETTGGTLNLYSLVEGVYPYKPGTTTTTTTPTTKKTSKTTKSTSSTKATTKGTTKISTKSTSKSTTKTTSRTTNKTKRGA